MKFQDIKDVLTFTAFLPEPDDSTATWRKRFSGRKAIFFNIGKNILNWMPFGKGCKCLAPGKAEGDLKEMFHNLSLEWKKATEGGWCGISLNTRYVISLENNLSRRKGYEELLKTNPRQILGSKYEKGKRYSVTHNPETNSSLLLTCDEEQVKRIETLLTENGMRAGRICVGTYAMLRHLTQEVEKLLPKGQPPDPQFSQLYVVCNQGSVCILSQQGVQWMELRSRSDVYAADDVTPILDLLAPFQQKMVQQSSVALLCNDVDPMISGAIAEFFKGVQVLDFTKKNHLWALLCDNLGALGHEKPRIATPGKAEGENSEESPKPVLPAPVSASETQNPSVTVANPPPLPPPLPDAPKNGGKGDAPALEPIQTTPPPLPPREEN